MKHAVLRRLGRPALVVALAAGVLPGGVAPAAAAAAAGSTAYATGTLGPFGFGGVKLGMSTKQARATRKIVSKPSWSPCTGWDLKAHPTGRDNVGLYISKRRGVAMIFAPKGVTTPQGIRIGSTETELKEAYPRLRRSASGGPVVAVPGNPKASYYFLLRRGRISEMVLALNDQDCAN
ncbi:hypothetical protein [Microtetraspora niveoalba]|uniref:hypothetical protein n=1 Tax=Microtetraspora niveoalba TaxID=46175 RepID=UPI0009FBE6BE|nr:hypothetical protein [Microtetraspora niveoalba]